MDKPQLLANFKMQIAALKLYLRQREADFTEEQIKKSNFKSTDSPTYFLNSNDTGRSNHSGRPPSHFP
jgi:hypothetical protein